MTGLITVTNCLSYSDLVVGVVAHPGCDAQKPGGGSLPCSIANTKFTSPWFYNYWYRLYEYKLVIFFIRLMNFKCNTETQAWVFDNSSVYLILPVQYRTG